MTLELVELAGVGPETARKLSELGIGSADDLLAYVPRAYRDLRTPTPVAALREGDGEVVVVGTVQSVKERANARFPLVTVMLADASGTVAAKWFGRRHLFGRFAVGDRLVVYGRVARAGLLPELNVASHRELRGAETYRGEIVPVYGATKDLPSRTIRTIVAKNLDRLVARRAEALPARVRAERDLIGVHEAWREVHQPTEPAQTERARRRIVFDEFFGLALAAALKRARRAHAGGAPILVAPDGFWERFLAGVPYAPTAAQARVIAALWRDMARPAAMNRLVQGDVGSGKTLVAAAAIVLAHAGGVQSALMAPTEILAAQHAAKLAPVLLPFGITVDAVFGSMGARERRAAEDRIATGAAVLAVGTHALLTETVTFARLGLVVIDEQHRFGVAQRARLRAKSGTPHALYLSATPIPRTLAQTKYADLDLSVIDELPPGRTPIETYVIRRGRMAHVEEFVRANVAQGRQAYVVAPAIEDGERGLASAVAEAERLRTTSFADLRVDLLHGKMTGREKDAAMGRFARGETDVLVATTVVEVGVDVPNASVMVVLDAQRYGLAQLHQLRGRVGRGVERSFCILVAPDDAVEIERLEILAATTDGFAIAEADLRLRRAGELAGTAQAGTATTVGDIVDDFALYVEAKAEADAIVAADPELAASDHAGLARFVETVPDARAMLVSA